MTYTDLNVKIMEIRESWGESSEYCQDQIMEEIEKYVTDVIGWQEPAGNERLKARNELRNEQVKRAGLNPSGRKPTAG